MSNMSHYNALDSMLTRDETDANLVHLKQADENFKFALPAHIYLQPINLKKIIIFFAV